MKGYKELVDEASKKFRVKYKKIESVKHLILMAQQIEYLLNAWYTFIDSDGINLSVPPMTIKDILITLDELFWSKDIETSDPKKVGDSVRVSCYGKPGIYLIFTLKSGDGCYKVQTGVREEPTYEWKCFDKGGKNE